MPCDLAVINADVTLDCNDVPIGGITKAMVAKLSDITSFTEVDGEITVISVLADKVVDLEFNSKDGFSNFTDVKTVDDSGIVTAIPTIALEFPKMTLAKRNALDNLTTSGLELVCFIETAAGERHACGLDFGLMGSEVSGQSGTGRTEKNTYSLTITGEETNLSRLIDSATWADLLTKVKAV